MMSNVNNINDITDVVSIKITGILIIEHYSEKMVYSQKKKKKSTKSAQN
jgi:hypothetical protein